jgi:hypothetical protein
MFSFPPENFLTMLVPGLFGNLTGTSYWGRCYLWEMSAFFGLTGLTMAIFGMTARFPGRAICLSMIGVTVVLALGNHTPLFPLLFRFVPGFDHFRSHSKFLVQALPFIAILTAQGMDRVLRSPNHTRMGAIGALVMALIAGAAGLSLHYYPTAPSIQDRWDQVMNEVAETGESYVPRENYSDLDFISEAASYASEQCFISAAILFALALLLWLRNFHHGAAFALVALGIGEMFWFANTSITSFSLSSTVPATIADFVENHPGDYRILQLSGSNDAIAIGADDIWGYDPMVLQRYAQLMTYSQGGNPDDASMYVNFSRASRLFRLLRMRYTFANEIPVYEMKDVLPHLLLVSAWTRMNDRNEILNSLNSPEFKPEQTAILETDPNPAPGPGEGSAGTAQIVQADTSSMIISAHLSRPAILLITDCYSRYWRAVAQPGSSQQHYSVLPADYTLMAVALAAGDHSLRLEYAPPGYIIGRWISLAGVILFLLAVGLVLVRSRTHRSAIDGI